MSYLRAGSIFKYVEGESKDYVFPESYKKGKKTIYHIVDYGSITNEGLVELFFIHVEAFDSLCPEFDNTLTDYLLKKLAEKLKVKLRKKPLTNEQVLKLMLKKCKKK